MGSRFGTHEESRWARRQAERSEGEETRGLPVVQAASSEKSLKAEEAAGDAQQTHFNAQNGADQ